MMELTFNLTEDRREPLKPQSLKDFELTFGNGSGVNVQSNNWVQGRLQMDNLRQAFVNIQQGKDNEPFDITGYILQFCGRTPFDGKQQSYRVIDNSSVVVDGLHGRFRYTFPAQAFAVAGTYKQAYFRLIRLSDYKCIATLEFDLSVLEDFVFADMVPSDYISPFNDILNQLLDGEKKFKADTQTLYEEAAKRLNDAVTQLTQLGTDVKTTLTTEQTALQQLIEKIKENNLFTQAEADTFKQAIQRQFDELLKLSFEEGSEDNVTAQQSKSLYSYASEGLAKREALASNVLRVGTLNLALDGALNIGIDVYNFWSETDKAARRQTDNQMAMDWMGCNIVGCQEAMSSMLSGSYNSFNRAMADDSMYPNLYVGLSPEVNHQLQTHNGMREGNAIFADRQMSYVALTAYSSDPNRSYLAYRTTFNNKNVLVVVTHNNVNDESEFEQLATFCGQQVFDACIILADTNNDPDSQCIAKLLAAGFDIVSKKDDNTMITEPAYSGHQMQIFYKGCVLQKKELYDVTIFEGSDHKAIVAEFKVGD